MCFFFRITNDAHENRFCDPYQYYIVNNKKNNEIKIFNIHSCHCSIFVRSLF